METVLVRGVEIAYRRRGRGIPLVLLHGAFGDSREWIDDLPALSGHAEVIAWDAPGCGASSDVPSDWAAGDWSDAVVGFIDSLGLDRPVACGLSLGSVLALLVARDHPTALRGLVLAGPYAGWAGSLDPTDLERRIRSIEATISIPAEQWADEFLASTLPADTPVERVAAARAALLEWRPATTAALLSAFARLDLRAALPRITVPTLVVRGAQDLRSPFVAAAAIARAIPRARLVEIGGLGHDCTGPDFDAAVVRFLAGLGATSSSA